MPLVGETMVGGASGYDFEDNYITGQKIDEVDRFDAAGPHFIKSANPLGLRFLFAGPLAEALGLGLQRSVRSRTCLRW